MGSPTGTAPAAATANFSRVDRIKKLPYRPANIKLADVKKAINAVIRERSVRKDSK
jgi:hypothetical protein